jgi:Alginate export
MFLLAGKHAFVLLAGSRFKARDAPRILARVGTYLQKDDSVKHLGRLHQVLFISLGTVLWTGSLKAQNQAPPADTPAAPAETSEPTFPTGGDLLFSGERTWSGPPGERPKTFWETVPPITPYPRPGNFFVAPSGPGYYTILDLLRGNELQDRPHDPYLQWGQNANPFFNVDFRYLDDPDNTEVNIIDPLKRIHLGDTWLLSLGGEFRDRYNDLQNAYLYDKKPKAGSDDTFNLLRVRAYEDLWYCDIFRIYAEFISADSSPQTVPHASTDIDKADLLNLFAELKLFSIDDNGVYLRGGRQQLMFGSQRLISPSDWANTPRTFEGVRTTYHNQDLEFDAWWVQPVVINTGKFDSVDDKQQFFGNWWKYRFTKDTSLDVYYLLLDNNNRGVATGQYKATGGFDVNTFGARYVGEAKCGLLWDFEDDIQFGEWVNQQTLAGMSATGLGWYFKNLPATPTAWLYFDWASGDPHPGVGDVHRTFDQLFPFGHQYFDSLDVIGRQNIDDLHMDFAMFPAPWMRITAGYHYLTLDSAKDALYNSTGSVVRSDPTGRAGTDVGNAINTTIQFHLDYYQIVNVSYSYLFSGPFIEKTAVNAAAAKDLQSLWVTYSFKW